MADRIRSTLDISEGTLLQAFRTVAVDGPLTLTPTDRVVLLQGTTAGVKAATLTAGRLGHLVDLRLVTATAGSYTIAVGGGTVTLDAANEGCTLVHDGTTWQLLHLHDGATFV